MSAFTAIAAITCPFCDHKATIQVGDCDGEPVLMHDAVYCREFEDLDADVFLRRARLAGGRVAPLEPIADLKVLGPFAPRGTA
jgi:hypothetical protein